MHLFQWVCITCLQLHVFHIIKELSWTLNTKVYQLLFFLWTIKQVCFFTQFGKLYRCTVMSILDNCMAVWYGSWRVESVGGWWKLTKVLLIHYSSPLRLSGTSGFCKGVFSNIKYTSMVTDFLLYFPLGGAAEHSLSELTR